MRVDTNFFCTVPMPDAGDPAVPATSRRYGNDDVIACYENLVAWAKTADEVGIDTMWLTEHHFQYEGYELTPNLVLFGLHLAGLTERLRFGQMFNVVPQWHPLRLAEDFAMADVLSGGRMVFGVGRGTVPREAQSLGAVVASGDNDALIMVRDVTDQKNAEEARQNSLLLREIHNRVKNHLQVIRSFPEASRRQARGAGSVSTEQPESTPQNSNIATPEWLPGSDRIESDPVGKKASGE